MDQPETETMEVLVVVTFPKLDTHVSEEAWEQDIVNAVSTAVYADKTIDTLEVRSLDYEDCKWVFELGMPMPEYGVTVGGDGSWHSGIDVIPENPEAGGRDLQSLFDYLVEKRLVKK